jgi:hypothetical protein
MTSPSPVPDVEVTETRSSWFTRPLAAWACVLGWCVATGAFVACVAVPGGPAVGDAFELIYPTWAFSHGQLVCMYPPHPLSISTFAAPVYPIIAGSIGFVANVGGSVPFPSGTALGHSCAKAVTAMVGWSQRGNAVWPTIRTGYVVWLFLMVGVILLLRATGRGRSGWEPTTLLIVACLPPVWFCVEMYAHPQDVVAMGFALAAMACALRSHWIGAGILIAVAILTQQFTLLVAIPLFVVAPTARRIPFVLSAVAAAAVISVPLIAVTSGAATRPIFAGSGASGGVGGTVMWEFHVRGGASLLLASRLPPLVLSLALAWYVVRRLGPAALQPAVLISLVAVSLSFRLVFEDNIFSYYYMALAVTLVILDVVRGRIRQTLVAWVAMITLVYTEPTIIVWRQSWDQDARRWIPVIIMVVGLLLIVRDVLRHSLGWNTAMWAAAVLTALIMWPVSSDPVHFQVVTWLWQVVLVGIGVVLAAGPLRVLVRERSGRAHAAEVEQPASLTSPSAGG